MIYNLKVFVFSLLTIMNVHSSLNAQQYSIDTTRVDVNNDKIIDTLIDDFSSGSTFGGREVTIIDGKTKKKFMLNNFGCYCSLTRLIKIPDDLLLEKNKPFLDTLKNRVIYHTKKDSIDATLQWILSASLNKKDEFNGFDSEGNKHPYFDVILNPKTQWESYKPFIPKPYYIEVAGDTLQRFLEEVAIDATLKEKPKGYLTYYTSRLIETYRHSIGILDSLQPIGKNTFYEIYKTPHSVYVKKGDVHKWLFISEAGVTGAPDNLGRWESIKQVQLIDQYVVIHQDVPPDSAYNIIILNIETQRVGILAREYEPSYNNWTDEGGLETFEIIDGQLVFSEYGTPELHKIPLKELFKSLDSYKSD